MKSQSGRFRNTFCSSFVSRLVANMLAWCCATRGRGLCRWASMFQGREQAKLNFYDVGVEAKETVISIPCWKFLVTWDRNVWEVRSSLGRMLETTPELPSASAGGALSIEDFDVGGRRGRLPPRPWPTEGIKVIMPSAGESTALGNRIAIRPLYCLIYNRL